MSQKVQNSAMSGATKKDVYKIACVEVATDLEGEGEMMLQRRIVDMVQKHNASGMDFKLEILPIPRFPMGERSMIAFNRFVEGFLAFERKPSHSTAQQLELVSSICANYTKPVAIVGAGKPIGSGFLSSLIKQNQQ
ncbi:hypothetical protein ASESINO_142 [Erwinia phage vB_EamM_Asesino]|uniref:Uncharacterized protein n=1 Tax=Erwinia phage vB_EamM_Asesino TaxID=1883370 RepID=A0A1B2IAA7_9CAUD|nr:hypothetical protein ASESINO_142 [Erwinia phage vB_EamM_Asesino]ANZ48155.1 hypothetical protein ASESINO_142 [Erwinia phage vB_EamM_Asesino]